MTQRQHEILKTLDVISEKNYPLLETESRCNNFAVRYYIWIRVFIFV